MISTPDIYSDNETQVASDLSPSKRRLPIWLAWFQSILQPQQWLNDLVFTKYYGGSSAPAWVSGNPYSYGDDVLYLDNSIYECVNPAGITSTTPPNLDSANWIKILNTFIGIAERIKYTGQKCFLEFFLNRYFQVTGTGLPFKASAKWYNNVSYLIGQNVYYTDGNLYTCILANTNQLPTNNTYWVKNPSIYIVRKATNNNTFWMATLNTGTPNSYMPLNSNNSAQWMPLSATTSQPYAFTVYVPSVLASSINTNLNIVVPGTSDNYQTLITNLLSKYVRAGKMFNVTTY
jgi:hypothetical protein